MLGCPLHVVTAVVDALPASELHGKEGLAYLYRQVPHNEYELWTRGLEEAEKKGYDSKSARSGPGLGELSFMFDGLATANVPSDLIQPNRSNDRTYTVTLPLAQTLFSTGRATTMQLTCFAPDSDDNNRLRLVHQEELHSAGLTLPFKHAEYNENIALEVSAHFPLTPLTPPRRINDCLGNVIRTISAFPTFGANRYRHMKHSQEPKDQTASQELEEAISAYFTRHNIPPEAVEVFALIIPFKGADFAIRDEIKERYKSVRSLIQFSGEITRVLTPLTIDQGIRDLIVNGHARLCKVLSGGGGWGEKKGLLSLDPDSYAPLKLGIGNKVMKFDEEIEGLDWPKDELAMGMKGLKSVVEVGESVMFFLASSKSRDAPTKPANFRLVAIGGERRASESWKDIYSPSETRRTYNHLVLGTVPSVMDALPASAPVPSDTSPGAVSFGTAENHDVQHIPHLFGALSASPLSLTTTSTEAALDDARARGKHSDYVHSQTMLGVPGLRLVVERSRTGVQQKFFKAKPSPTGVVQSDWYAGTWHETSKKLDLGRQREELEASFKSQRDARTPEELQRDVEWIERQRRRIEDVTRVEDMFECMSDAEAAEYARDGSPADKTAASASEQALSTPNQRLSATEQQSSTDGRERGK